MSKQKQKQKTTRSRFRFLDPEYLEDAGESQLDGLSLAVQDFSPQEDQEPLGDGCPPTKLGSRLRTAIAAANGIDEEDIDDGLIRSLEVLSADHAANIQALARPYQLRNQAGHMKAVRFLAHTPLIGGAVLNGRMLSRTGQKLPRGVRVLTSGTEHPTLPFPQLDVDDGEQMHAISLAQRVVEQLRDYGPADRDFIDSIATQGVLTPPVIAPFHVVDSAGNSGWITQTDDGWRRCTASKEVLSEILGVNADLTYRHWEDEDGQLTIRDYDETAVRQTLSRLRFRNSDKADLLFPGSRTKRGVERWVNDVAKKNPEVRVFHRLRVVEVELVLSFHPRPDRTCFDVFYIDMASRHVPGLAAKDWNKDAVEGVVAVRAIDALIAADQVLPEQRSVWLGETTVGHADIEGQMPFRNRVAAGAELMAVLTTDGDGHDEGEKRKGTGRRKVVREILKEHGLRNHPDKAATVAAAQAAVVFGLSGSAEIGQVSAAIASIFKHASLWRDHDHNEGSWASCLSLSSADLYDNAVIELGEDHDLGDPHLGALGPNQRAMMAMTGIAHATNPAMLGVHALTRTGRGGRNKVSKADPISLLQRMVVDEEGLERCLEIIEAATCPEPRVPVDPVTDAEMTEEWLRAEYLSQTDDEFEPEDDPDDLDPETSWWTDLDTVLELSENLWGRVQELEKRLVPAGLLGLTDDQYDSSTAGTMLIRYGVKEELAGEVRRALEKVIKVMDRGAVSFSIRKGQ